MEYPLTLDNVVTKRRFHNGNWEDWDGQLTPDQRHDLFEILGKGCRADTKAKLSQALTNNCRYVRSCGILGRVHLTPRVQYVAGQSYPDEIRIVRQVVIAAY